MRSTAILLLAMTAVLAGCIHVNVQENPAKVTDDSSQSTSKDTAAAPHADPREPANPNSSSARPDVNSTPVPGNSNRPWSLRQDGWAAPDKARVYPGAMVMSYHGGCTTNFIFTDLAGTTVYAGTAGHCAASRDDSNELVRDPCALLNPPEPAAHMAYFGPNLTWNNSETADAVGRYVYNSWWHMLGNETDAYACAYNDFALIEIAPEHRHLVNPSLESWGGPTGQHNASLKDSDNLAKLYTVGGTWLRDQSETAVGTPFNPLYYTRPREGFAMPLYDQQFPTQDWYVRAYFPIGHCLPGDSGAPVLYADGTALGLLTAMDNGAAATCAVTYLWRVLELAQQAAGLELVLHMGTQQFTGGPL